MEFISTFSYYMKFVKKDLTQFAPAVGKRGNARDGRSTAAVAEDLHG